MKNHTPEERREALAKLPQPIADFLRSQTITNIYVGIGQKLKLNVRQLGTVSNITNTILLGLEPQHALETSLHQEIPELDNATTRELVDDLNDRVFKEAQRRMREKITAETPPAWDEKKYGPAWTKEDFEEYEAREKQEDERPISDEELHKLVLEEAKKHTEEEAAPEEITPSVSPAVVNAPANMVMKQGQPVAPRDVREIESEPVDVHSEGSGTHVATPTPSLQNQTTPQSIAGAKLAGTTVSTPSITHMDNTMPSDTIQKTAAPRIDPYRESPE